MEPQETPEPATPGSTITPQTPQPAEPPQAQPPEAPEPPEPQATPPDTSEPPQEAAAPQPAPVQAPPPPQQKAPDTKKRAPNILPVTEPGEHTICVIKRHRIGILGVYVMCGLVVLVTALLAFIVVPSFASDNRGTALLAGGTIFLAVAVICAVFAWISAKVYWGNTWTLTSDSLTQVRHLNLFNRQSSQLSLKDLEDVTAEQNGIFPEMFNYGLLKVETAGEKSKFRFPFCPNPNYYAQQILAAREAFERNRKAAEENVPAKTP